MNRLNYEVVNRTYTMEIDREHTDQEQMDWEEMWMFNRIIGAVRRPCYSEVRTW